MAYNLLILDDDADFNGLLTDVFEQADYVVTSVNDPVEAVEIFGRNRYDLVVTDFKMPEMNGAHFVRAIKKLKPEIPVIMVSGFLENDTIRELIRDGVGGVFLKPLNIFSLLERATELIDASSKKVESASAKHTGGGEEDCKSGVSFAFRSFPCRAATSIAFAEKLFKRRDFKTTLTLSGPKGSPFRKVCEDIANFGDADSDCFAYLDASEVQADRLLQIASDKQAEGFKQITFVFQNLEKLQIEQSPTIVQLAKQGDLFANLAIQYRIILCMTGDLDTLFENGIICDSLYITAGTVEVSIPALAECSADVGILAQQTVVRLAREKMLSPIPRLDTSARARLRQHSWPGNSEELYDVIDRLLTGHRSETIGVAHVDKVLNAETPKSAEENQKALREYLSHLRADLSDAIRILSHESDDRGAEFFGKAVGLNVNQ